MQVHLLANEIIALGHALTCYSFSPKPADAEYDHIQLSTSAVSRLLKKFVPGLTFGRLKKGSYDVLHFHGDDYLTAGSPRRVRTFYGSAFYEAIFATSIARFLYQTLFYGFELLSCARKGTKVGISSLTSRCLPGISTTIPCGVRLDTFCPGGEKTVHPSILCIGDLDSRKHCRDIVAAFEATILPRWPEAELTIIGPDSIDKRGVRCLSNADQSTLIAHYQRSWVFCIASSYEGFGVPIIEACACGTPVVAVSTRGARDLVNHNVNGFLCSRENLGSALAQMLNDASLRTRLRDNALRSARAFDIARIAQLYLSVYSNLTEHP